MSKLKPLLAACAIVILGGYVAMTIKTARAKSRIDSAIYNLGPSQENTTHDYLWDGIKLFVSATNYKGLMYHTLATVIGSDLQKTISIRGRDYDSIRLKLVTQDRKNLNILVVGNTLDLQLLMHEVSPHTGKYKWWSPVLAVEEWDRPHPEFSEDGDWKWKYFWYDIKVVGRFRIKWDNKEDPSKIASYQTELYY